ncbi:MAG: ABC transporter permease, partial [Candidatus Limnocylindria bacterium]
MAQVVRETVTGPPVRPAEGEPTAAVIGRSPWDLFWRRFRRDRFAIVGIVIIVFMALVASIGAPLAARLAGQGPNDVAHPLSLALNEIGLPVGPNNQFWFGADTAGRDLFVRVMYGARTSLTVALLATGMALVIGVVLGL